MESSCNVTCCSGVTFLKWEDCDTIGKKIGFIAGQCLNSLITNCRYLIDKRRAEIRAARQKRSSHPGLIKKIFQVISKIFSWLKINVFNHCCALVTQFANSAIIKNISVNIKQYVFKPIFNYFSPYYQKLTDLVKTFLFKVYDSLKNRVSLIFRSSFTPLIIKINDVVCNFIKPILKPVWNNMAVPFGNKVVIPCLKSIGDFIHALISGTANPKQDKERVN
jgi:hypothetical protein